MIHRHCRTEAAHLREQVARLETEIRVADRRAGDAQNDAARLRTEAESATSRGWDAAGDAEHLRDQLTAAQEHQQDLNDQIRELKQQLHDLTEDNSPVAVARTRQTRAITRALISGEEAYAQVLTALPWQAFHPDLELLGPVWEGRWWLEGEERKIFEVENLLRWRYGLTETESTNLREEVLTRFQQNRQAEYKAADSF